MYISTKNSNLKDWKATPECICKTGRKLMFYKGKKEVAGQQSQDDLGLGVTTWCKGLQLRLATGEQQQQDHRRISPLPLSPSGLPSFLFSPAHLSLLSQVHDAMPRPPAVVLRAPAAFLGDPLSERHFPPDPARFDRSLTTAPPQALARPPPV